MALSQFPIAFARSAETSIRAADLLRALRDSTGDLPWNTLGAVQGALRNAKVAATEALSEANKRPATAEAYMADMGGPSTLIDFQNAMGAIETAATAYNARVQSMLNLLTVSEVMWMEVFSADGIDTQILKHNPAIPNANPDKKADHLRVSQELADLIAAFESAGA